jgi:serine/threonine-protein kinase
VAGAWRIGPYEVIFRIGWGGMAEVFAARLKREAGFQKLVAVKRIHPALAEEDRFTRMFLEEARVGAQLTGPHVVQTLDLGRDDAGVPYVVQELVVGIDLDYLRFAAEQRGRPLPRGVVVSILIQAALGLHDAHEAIGTDGRPLGLVHRDVSPHNLVVGADGRVRVTDFGIARVVTDRLVETETGVVKGKLAYLSPEQAEGAEIDRRSDVFALGVVAWEILSGQRLFSQESPAATLEAVKTMPVPHLADVVADVPRPIADVVAHALERSPDARLATARAFADGLVAAAHDLAPRPTELAVAELVEDLSLPRLAQLRDRVRRITQNPTIVTLPDLDAASPEDDAATLLLGAGETTSSVATRVRPPSIAATDWAPRPIPRAWVGVLAVILGAAGIALGIAALVLLLSR